MAKLLPPDPAPDAADSRAAKNQAPGAPSPAWIAARRVPGGSDPSGRVPKPSEISPRKSPPAVSVPGTDVPRGPSPRTDRTSTDTTGPDATGPDAPSPVTTSADAPSAPLDAASTGDPQRRRPSPLDVISHRRDVPDAARISAARHRMPRSDEYSAGGLVVNRRGHVPAAAIIGRTDRRGRLLWSLPKGHIEAGETAAQAAVREVEEETGIVGKVVAPLGKIDYWFVADGRRVHKTVTHFLMKAVGGELSDEDAEVVAVEWVPLDNLSRRLAYADERRIAIDAIRILADIA